MPGSPSERQYHIGLAPGEVAETVLLCGDPDRARRIAERLDDVGPEIAHREYVTLTGHRGGRPLSVMATGIGCDNTEIAIVELLRVTRRPTFLRLGTCGGIAPETDIGDLVVSTGSLRMESTSLAFVEEGYPAMAHHEVVLAMLAGASTSGRTVHHGITACAPGFYGAQGRVDDERLPSRFPERVAELRRQGVVNMEMESSTLFTLSTLAGVRAGTLCVVYANREKNRFAGDDERPVLQDVLIEAGLAAVDALVRLDDEKGDDAYWLPPSIRG